MIIFGRGKKKSLQERKLTLIQQIKEIESQLNSMKVRDFNDNRFCTLKHESAVYR